MYNAEVIQMMNRNHDKVNGSDKVNDKRIN